MTSRTRRLQPAMTALLLAVIGAASLLIAGDDPQDEEQPPAKAQPDAKDASAKKDSAPELKQIVGRMSPADRTLVEQFAASGKLPAERQDRRVIAVLDTPFLGSENYGF